MNILQRNLTLFPKTGFPEHILHTLADLQRLSVGKTKTLQHNYLLEIGEHLYLPTYKNAPLIAEVMARYFFCDVFEDYFGVYVFTKNQTTQCAKMSFMVNVTPTSRAFDESKSVMDLKIATIRTDAVASMREMSLPGFTSTIPSWFTEPSEIFENVKAELGRMDLRKDYSYNPARDGERIEPEDSHSLDEIIEIASPPSKPEPKFKMSEEDKRDYDSISRSYAASKRLRPHSPSPTLESLLRKLYEIPMKQRMIIGEDFLLQAARELISDAKEIVSFLHDLDEALGVRHEMNSKDCSVTFFRTRPVMVASCITTDREEFMFFTEKGDRMLKFVDWFDAFKTEAVKTAVDDGATADSPRTEDENKDETLKQMLKIISYPNYGAFS